MRIFLIFIFNIFSVIILFIAVTGVCIPNACASDNFVWYGGTKTAVSLSYDDALDSQLDHAIPALKAYGFNASFYLTLSSTVVKDRRQEWKKLAQQGHELGNHSIFHPCRASLPNRDWVKPKHDLDKISAQKMVEEVIAANHFLFDMDGKEDRTFTPPCRDKLANGVNYLTLIESFFVAIKGEEKIETPKVLWIPYDVNGDALIDFVKRNTEQGMLINIIFHGIGGDHLPVSVEAHKTLLRFLHHNRSTYWVDSYINIMKFQSQKVADDNVGR